MISHLRSALIVATIVCVSTIPAFSQDNDGKHTLLEKPKEAAREAREEEHKPADPDTGKSSLSPDTLGLLPNPYVDRGVKFTLSYVGESLANMSGGLHRGVIYEGRLNAAIDLNFGKLASRPGLSFHANVFQIHGPGLSRNYIGNLITVSSIEALATTRLYELWFEQKFANDKWSVRAGQLAADTEFITSKYTDVFFNGTFGWPTITAVNLPSGGPSPPLAAIGARLKAQFSEQVTWMSAVFNGDAAGPGNDDPQSRNRYGLNFRVRDPALLINEVQFAYNQTKGSIGLPGTLKVGAWYHAGDFVSQRFASNGYLLADARASAEALQLRGNQGFYAVLEQQLLAIPGDGSHGLGAFVRAASSPPDRNLVDFYIDGGLNLAGAFSSRPDDKLGVGVAYARISKDARALDEDYRTIAASLRPVRDYEALVAFNYLAQIRQGWIINPTVQYVIHPGGGYVLDAGIPRPTRNAVVVGARTVLKF